MEKSNIFIVSSSRALLLAEKMKSALMTNYAEAEVWSEVSRSVGSKTIIEMLMQATKDYDYAVIILTQDDVTLKGGIGKKHRKARDNCIFEAGLFMGAFERERCFLVSNVKSNDLPVDLKGVIYKQIDNFNEKKDLKNIKKCELAIRKPANEIISCVKEKARLNRPKISILTLEDLFEREQVKPPGDLLIDQVVVNTLQPEESKYRFARKVKDNIDKGIVYYYFFKADNLQAHRICKLLQMLLVVDLIDDPKKQDQTTLLQIIKDNPEKVLENLEKIVAPEGGTIAICILPDNPTFQYCIHNATNANAIAYLKLDLDEANFIEFARGNEAMDIWRSLYQSCLDLSTCVFRLSLINNLPADKSKSFKESLDLQLSRHFPPPIYERVKMLCYGRDDFPNLSNGTG